MAPTDAALLALIFIVFGVPALALAARLAIRPSREVERLSEAEAFHRQLLQPANEEKSGD